MINDISFWKSVGEKLYVYTKGKEYSLDGVEYIGYYHISNSVPYSEYKPSTTSRKLYPYKSSDASMIYDKLKPEYLKLDTYNPPYQAPLLLTAAQYESGKITRYFLKKRNENIIYEINKNMVGKLGSEGGIDDIMYQLTSMDWMISINGISYELINFNTKSLAIADLEMPGVRNKITSMYEYSIVDVTP